MARAQGRLSRASDRLRARREWARGLLRLRQREIVPLLAREPTRADAVRLGEAALAVEWAWAGGPTLRLLANLSPACLDAPVPRAPGRCLFATRSAGAGGREVGGWYTAYYLIE